MGTSVRSSHSVVVRAERRHPPTPSRPSRRSVVVSRRAPSSSPSPMSSPCTRHARTPRTMVASDFVEILKLYDKNADDTILEFELFKLLVNLGEKLTKERPRA